MGTQPNQRIHIRMWSVLEWPSYWGYNVCMHIIYIYIHKICIIYVYICMYTVYNIRICHQLVVGNPHVSGDDLESSLNFWKMWSLSLAFTKPWGRNHMSYIYIYIIFIFFLQASSCCRSGLLQSSIPSAHRFAQNQPLCVGHIDIYIYIYIYHYIYHYIYISLYIYIYHYIYIIIYIYHYIYIYIIIIIYIYHYIYIYISLYIYHYMPSIQNSLIQQFIVTY